MREEEKKSKSDLFITLVIFISFIFGMGTALAPAPAMAAPSTISMDTSYTVDVNSNVTVPVKITNATDIVGGLANVSFNPSIVNVQELLSGDFSQTVPNFNNTVGWVSIACSNGFTPIGIDNATLASIKFNGISKGITALNFTDAYLNYESGTGFTPTTSDGKINVSVYNNNPDSPTSTPSPSPSSSPDDSATDTGATTEPGSSSGSPDGHDYADSATTSETETITSTSSNANDVNSPLSITIGSFTTYVNTNVTVPVELLNANDIAGGSAKITFNPLSVNAIEVLPGDFGTPIANINNSAGFVYIACASPTAVGKDTAKLASITFVGLSEGLSSLNPQDAAFNDEAGNLIIPETTSNGEINVAPRTPSPPQHLPAADSTTLTIIALFVFSAIVIALLYLIGKKYKFKK